MVPQCDFRIIFLGVLFTHPVLIHSFGAIHLYTLGVVLYFQGSRKERSLSSFRRESGEEVD